ncbi:class I SAM-dependent methyltransferase [Azospirillum sp. YIM B02556]|uniref:Class I SAM-dependent methyltransferase n=1 Tax=Azospirillum endophyticum TaxID=2800326 RepID=A0ABS1FBJ5_9PROT|nr:class I SAM-dependent methyltransferase [Azospirillum endophyticum]MBK1840789.1 class I SAM-dependent methyltransferase [Azospirillum endophyticum]
METPLNRIPTAAIADLFPAVGAVGPLVLNAHLLDFRPEQLPVLVPYEHLTLAALARHIAPERILEIGTAQGRGTFLLAANTPDTTRIVTIDLPPEQRDDYTQACLNGDNDVSRLYRGTAYEPRIDLVLADSTTLDPAALRDRYGAMDLILIDGNHSFEAVKADTELALKVATEDALFIWHDFYSFPDYVADRSGLRGVFPFLNGWNGGGRLQLRHVMGTYFVLGRRRWPEGTDRQLLQPGDGGPIFGTRIARLADTGTPA